MPGFDGTGPRGQGPLTGGGRGYCVVRLPDHPAQPAVGFAGLMGRLFAGRLPRAARPRLGLGLGRGWGRRR
jgi:hypothetical protein